MLYRIEQYNAVEEALLNNGMIYETIKVLEEHPNKEFDITLLVSQAHSVGDEKLIRMVSQFINKKLF